MPSAQASSKGNLCYSKKSGNKRPVRLSAPAAPPAARAFNAGRQSTCHLEEMNGNDDCGCCGATRGAGSVRRRAEPSPSSRPSGGGATQGWQAPQLWQAVPHLRHHQPLGALAQPGVGGAHLQLQTLRQPRPSLHRIPLLVTISHFQPLFCLPSSGPPAVLATPPPRPPECG